MLAAAGFVLTSKAPDKILSTSLAPGSTRKPFIKKDSLVHRFEDASQPNPHCQRSIAQRRLTPLGSFNCLKMLRGRIPTVVVRIRPLNNPLLQGFVCRLKQRNHYIIGFYPPRQEAPLKLFGLPVKAYPIARLVLQANPIIYLFFGDRQGPAKKLQSFLFSFSLRTHLPGRPEGIQKKTLQHFVAKIVGSQYVLLAKLPKLALQSSSPRFSTL